MTENLVLNFLESKYYYDHLRFIFHNPQFSHRQKLQQCNFTFLSLINALTEQKERQIFTGWFAKINFIAQAYNLSDQAEQELQALRRLLKRSQISNAPDPSRGQTLAALKILCNLIARFSSESIPEELIQLYEGQKLPRLVSQEKPQEILKVLHATILEKSELTFDDQQRGQVILRCDSEAFGQLQISIRDIHYHNATNGQVFRRYALSRHCATLIRPYQPICLINLEKIAENHYTNTSQTLLISSPDYLVDATSIANCFVGTATSAYLYLLDRLSFFRGNAHTFAGKLINDILDHRIESGESDFDKAFKHVFAQSQLEAALLELDTDKISELYHRIKPQFETIQKVMEDLLDREKEPKIITTEPTFISGLYGLQGRLDLLIEYPQQPERKDIIELKGTAFPSPQLSPARVDHLVQVACYNLLIDSTFDQRKGVSAILYSKDFNAPLRDCGKLNFQEQDATWMRNCIVFLDWQIAQGGVRFYDSFIQKLHALNLPVYKKEAADLFSANWHQSNDLEKIYFGEFMGLVAREMLVAKVGGVSEPGQGFASLWKDTPQEKLENFALLSGLILQKIDRVNAELTFKRPPENQEVTAFREGDIIVLYPIEASEQLQPDKYPLLKGNISSIDPEELKLKIWNRNLDENYFRKYPAWAIEPTLMESNFTHHFASLAAFLGFGTEKKRIFLGLDRPKIKSDFWVDYRPFLSDQQNKILNQALASEDYFLLQGPPGTGKTSKMLRTMVDYLYKYTEEVIVLLAFTNRATDEICQKIAEVCEHNFIRLGNIQEGHPFRAYSLKDEQDLDKIRQKIAKTRVFVSTVSSFYNNIHLIKRYDTVIVDEASQLLEPALCGILPQFRRFILIGDEKQLPAVVTQPSNFCLTSEPALHQIGIENMSVSVFERLLENAQNQGWTHCFEMLSNQFRTHEEIAGFISREFYKKLQIGSAEQQKKLDMYNPLSGNPWERFLAQSRLLFIPSGREENMKFHREEAQKVAELLRAIRDIFQEKGTFHKETVGVITPYRAQIAEIYKLLDEELRQKVTVDTVERYQGSERDIIIISMAVNHPAQMRNLQAFNLKQNVDKKLNVALSRAKEQVILLGNQEILETGKFYKPLLRYIKEK
ncbi:MAG: ATP-dependent helicase [Microscillaceae bacterium]|nr:ATP-dependent helicase [Microscillaceae bacterium]